MKILHALDPDGRPAWGRLAADGAAVELLDGDPFDGGAPFDRRPAREIVPLAGLRLLPPARPTKIVAVGRNYADHAKELGNDVPAEPHPLPQAAFGAARARAEASRCPRPRAASTSKASSRSSSDPACGERRRGEVARLRPRLHLRERRDRARPAEEGRPVHAREELRHLLPARPLDRDRPRRFGSRDPDARRRAKQDARTSLMIFPRPRSSRSSAAHDAGAG